MIADIYSIYVTDNLVIIERMVNPDKVRIILLLCTLS